MAKDNKVCFGFLVLFFFCSVILVFAKTNRNKLVFLKLYKPAHLPTNFDEM